MSSGVGDGSGGDGNAGDVMADGEDVPLGGTCAMVRVHAASRMTAVKLSAKRWAMEIRPERGGRITSLRLDGEELLDQGIGVDQPTANGFVEGGAFGWDEMVPNLDPTDTLPDHGEAWRLPWDVLGDGAMRCRGRLVPWELQRKIELGESVKVTYAYTNAGAEPHPAYWCAHPLFRYEPDMEVDAQVPRNLPEGMSTKVFFDRGSVDHVTLRWRSGAGIDLGWDTRVTPDLAIWICNGDLGGYRQIAVEPATASPMLAPGATLRWGLRIRAV